MSKLNTRLSELTTRLQSTSPSVAIQENLEVAHARLTRALRDRRRNGRLREVTEDALRSLAKSLELDSWSDDPSNGIKILSITGKIIVIDIAFDATTLQFKNCTLVLASADGLQDEIVVDGRDTMTVQLLNSDLDGFSRSLEKLAFLDKYSEPSVDLNLFHVQDTLREAINRRFAGNSDFSFTPISSTSHLDLSFGYHRACSMLEDGGEDNKSAGSSSDNAAFLAHLEIESRPISGVPKTSRENGEAAADVFKRPVLRYPKTWIDGSKSWLPNKQFLAARHQDELRYAALFDPAVTMPARLASRLVDNAMSRLEWEPLKTTVRSRRLLHTPSGPQQTSAIVHAEEELACIRKIAFSHPKELELILAHFRQHAIYQHLLASLAKESTSAPDRLVENVTPSSSWYMKQEYIEDAITSIDNRQSIRLSIYGSPEERNPHATILVQADYKLKCWHMTDEAFFDRAIRLTQDIPVAMIATAARSPKSALPIEDLRLDSDIFDRMDFRRDPEDPTSRNLAVNEAKQGYNYIVPVESQIEMKTGNSSSARSPTYLARIGKSLRHASSHES